MPSANVTVTTAANFIPELWATDAYNAAEFAQVIVKRCDQRFNSLMKHGDTLHVPVQSNLTAVTKSASTDVDFEAITENKTDVTIDQHKYAAFFVEDIASVQANQDLLASNTKKIGYALARAKETHVSGKFDLFSTTVGSAGAEPTYADYALIWQYLTEAGMGVGGNVDMDVALFLSPAMVAAAMQMDVFISRDYRDGANAVETANIGKILGMPIYVSNLLEADAAGQHDNAAMSKTSIIFIDQQAVKVESDRLIWKIGDAVVGHTIYGSAEAGFPPETAGGGALVDTRAVYFKGK